MSSKLFRAVAIPKVVITELKMRATKEGLTMWRYICAQCDITPPDIAQPGGNHGGGRPKRKR